MKRARIIDHVRTSLWFVPVMCVLAGVALSFATIAIDRHSHFKLIPETLTGGPDAALQTLSTVAASMVTLTALVLTITMVVVQLAMGQFSPRIVQRILRDKPSQLAIGIFVATFAHAMLAMREVRFENGGAVPGVAIVVAYLLILVSIVVLVLYVHHIGQSLRVSALIELVGRDTRALLDSLYPEEHGLPAVDDGPVVAAAHSGVVTRVDEPALVRIAHDTDCVFRMVPAVGDFVPAGAPLIDVEGQWSHERNEDVTKAFVLTLERSLEQDPAYGFRLLVDIAERCLSDSAFEDPTTAVQAIDRLHDCLRHLARRRFPEGAYKDDEGVVRLVVPAMDWVAYVRLAFEELRRAGARSVQVTRRLAAALEDLKTVAPPDRIPELDRQLELLADAVRAAGLSDWDEAEALVADRQGLGVRTTIPRLSGAGDGRAL